MYYIAKKLHVQFLKYRNIPFSVHNRLVYRSTVRLMYILYWCIGPWFWLMYIIDWCIGPWFG